MICRLLGNHHAMIPEETANHGLMESIVILKVRMLMQKTHSYFLKSGIKQQIWKRLKKNVLMDVMQTKIASMLKSFGFPVKVKCALFLTKDVCVEMKKDDNSYTYKKQ